MCSMSPSGHVTRILPKLRLFEIEQDASIHHKHQRVQHVISGERKLIVQETNHAIQRQNKNYAI